MPGKPVNYVDYKEVSTFSAENSKNNSEIAAELIMMKKWILAVKEIAGKNGMIHESEPGDDFALHTKGTSSENINTMTLDEDFLKKNPMFAVKFHHESTTKAMAGLLTHGVMGKMVEGLSEEYAGSEQFSTENQLYYYAHLIKPLMENNGAAYKKILNEAIDNDSTLNNEQKQEKRAKIDALYQQEKTAIEEALGKKPELKEHVEHFSNVSAKEMQEQLPAYIEANVDQYEAQNETENENELIFENENEQQLSPNLTDDADLNRQLAALYREKGQPGSFEDGLKKFQSTRILAFGHNSDSHDLVMENIKDLNSFQTQTKDLNSQSQEMSEQYLAALIYHYESIENETMRYMLKRTNDGKELPSTPAGKDRLMGAAELNFGARKALDDIKAQMTESGYDYDQFYNDPKTLDIRRKLIIKKLEGQDKLSANNSNRELSNRESIAELMIISAKLDDAKGISAPDMYNMKYKDLPLKEAATSLANDPDFAETYRVHLKSTTTHHDKFQGVWGPQTLWTYYQNTAERNALKDVNLLENTGNTVQKTSGPKLFN